MRPYKVEFMGHIINMSDEETVIVRFGNNEYNVKKHQLTAYEYFQLMLKWFPTELQNIRFTDEMSISGKFDKTTRTMFGNILMQRLYNISTLKIYQRADLHLLLSYINHPARHNITINFDNDIDIVYNSTASGKGDRRAIVFSCMALHGDTVLDTVSIKSKNTYPPNLAWYIHDIIIPLKFELRRAYAAQGYTYGLTIEIANYLSTQIVETKSSNPEIYEREVLYDSVYYEPGKDHLWPENTRELFLKPKATFVDWERIRSILSQY